MPIQHFLRLLLLLNALGGSHWLAQAAISIVNSSTFTADSILHLDARQTHVIYVKNSQSNTVHYYDQLNPANSYSMGLSHEIVRILSHDSNTLQSHNFMVEVRINPTQTELR